MSFQAQTAACQEEAASAAKQSDSTVMSHVAAGQAHIIDQNGTDQNETESIRAEIRRLDDVIAEQLMYVLI